MIASMADIFIFANPTAGRGRGTLFARKIQQSLIRAGHKVHVKLAPPSQIAEEHLCGITTAHAVIAIGGDGTLRAVAHRVMRCCSENPPPPLLIVPLGTANLMGKHLGIRWKPETMGREIVAALKQKRLQHLDVAMLRSDGESPEERLLMLVAGVGIDGRVVHELAKIRKGPITYASYALPTAIALGKYKFPTIAVRVDGKEIFAGRGIALIGNVRQYGTGFPVLPLAKADDGLLDICAMPCRNMAELLKLFVLVAAGKHLTARGVAYITGKTVEVTSDTPVEVQIDGDAAGWTPIKIEILPTQLAFCLPASPS